MMSAGYKVWKDRSLRVSRVPEISDFVLGGIFEEIQVVINVSDEYDFGAARCYNDEGITYYWFPMNEVKKDIGLNSLYAAMCVLRYCEEECLNVLVHCAAGTNRSPLVVQAYHFLRTGKQVVEDIDGGRWDNRLIRACVRGYLPPQKELEKFLYELGKHFNEKGHRKVGGSLDKIKRNTIFNF
jgi:hypothetical protein